MENISDLPESQNIVIGFVKFVNATYHFLYDRPCIFHPESSDSTEGTDSPEVIDYLVGIASVEEIYSQSRINSRGKILFKNVNSRCRSGKIKIIIEE